MGSTSSPLSPALLALSDHLQFLYGERGPAEVLPRLERLLAALRARPITPPPAAGPLSEQDAFLITYPDMVQHAGEPPLRTLDRFLARWVAPHIRGVHILPFYPFSSDDGFSVIDYRAVRDDLGDWDDLQRIASAFRLMADAVINHISARSDWFQAYLRQEDPYRHYFIALDPQTDLSAVVRPREHPLLTPVETAAGPRHVWTTFSADQIDLNFAHPDVLLDILDALLFYVRQGVQVIRLDAIAYLWKEVGTSCLHLPQTHRVVKLLRAVLEAVAPWVFLITETNVPHPDNVSYFGDGTDEAHLVYNFALPPLVLHTFRTGSSTALTRWAAGLHAPSARTTFFNFLASHDGIGLNGAHGILSPRDVSDLVSLAEGRGGVSYRSGPGGRRHPYELNLTYFDALTDPAELASDPDRSMRRFLAAHAIMLSLPGVPGVYFHSLFGSRNDHAGVERTGRLRAINRQKLERDHLERELADSRALRARAYRGLSRLLELRRGEPGFHPQAEMEVLDLGPPVFALRRRALAGGPGLLCLHEVQGADQRVAVGLPPAPGARPYDMVSGDSLTLESVDLAPYQVRWIRLDGEAHDG
jgi:sucrose phosphorylase